MNSPRGAGRFDATWSVAPGESLSIHLPPAMDRCGIYLLHFADGQGYVGQAVDVVRRVAQHHRKYPDIVAVSFRIVPAVELNQAELETIRAVERPGYLRNTLLTGHPAGASALDVLVPPPVRRDWIDGSEPEPATAVRGGDLSQPPSDGYSRLAARSDYPTLVDIVARYVSAVLVWPRTTEQRFWTVTALPTTRRGAGVRTLVTLTCNNRETLVLLETADCPPYGFLNVADLPGTGVRDRGTWALVRSRCYPHEAPVGGPIVQIDFPVLSDLARRLDSPAVRRRARALATNLMHKGPAMRSNAHSVHLASDIFAEVDRREGIRSQ